MGFEPKDIFAIKNRMKKVSQAHYRGGGSKYFSMKPSAEGEIYYVRILPPMDDSDQCYAFLFAHRLNWEERWQYFRCLSEMSPKEIRKPEFCLPCAYATWLKDEQDDDDAYKVDVMSYFALNLLNLAAPPFRPQLFKTSSKAFINAFLDVLNAFGEELYNPYEGRSLTVLVKGTQRKPKVFIEVDEQQLTSVGQTSEIDQRSEEEKERDIELILKGRHELYKEVPLIDNDIFAQILNIDESQIEFFYKEYGAKTLAGMPEQKPEPEVEEQEAESKPAPSFSSFKTPPSRLQPKAELPAADAPPAKKTRMSVIEKLKEQEKATRGK